MSIFRTHPSRDEGATLVELLVVLVILTVVTAAVSGSFRPPRPEQQIRSFAARLVAELRAARALALSTNNDVAFSFDPQARSFTIDGVASSASIDPSVTVTVVTAKEYVGDQSDAKVVFFGDGSSTGGRVIIGQGSRTVAIEVVWLSGQVRVEDGVP